MTTVRHRLPTAPTPAPPTDAEDPGDGSDRKAATGRYPRPPSAATILLALHRLRHHASPRSVAATLLVLPALLCAVVLMLRAAASLLSAIPERMRNCALENHLSTEGGGFHPQWHPRRREDRFPGVEERARLYMSDWYLPPCRPGDSYPDERVEYQYSTDGQTVRIGRTNGTSVTLTSRIRPDRALFLDGSQLSDCVRTSAEVSLDRWVWHGLLRPFFGGWYDGVDQRRNMRAYCVDATDILPLMGALHEGGDCDDVYWEGNFFVEGIGEVLLRSHKRPMRPPQRKRNERGRDGRRHGRGEGRPPPVVAQFGDHPSIVVESAGDPPTSSEAPPLPFPVVAKFRPAASAEEVARVTGGADTGGGGLGGGGGGRCVRHASGRPGLRASAVGESDPVHSPVLWRLESHRHYSMLPSVPYWDTPWEDKLEGAVWRGGLTGLDWRAIERLDPRDRERLHPRDVCVKYSPRCRLVYEATRSGSGLIDAGLTFMNLQGEDMPEVIDGVLLLREGMSMSRMMRYKAIISLQGNDIASGLKWSLFSKSVVIMPPPTVTSWAMEELLEPWVHFVPLEDVEMAEERVRWVLNHDTEARKMAERATLWVWDMFFHEDAPGDEAAVKAEILRRYSMRFSEGIGPGNPGDGAKVW